MPRAALDALMQRSSRISGARTFEPIELRNSSAMENTFACMLIQLTSSAKIYSNWITYRMRITSLRVAKLA